MRATNESVTLLYGTPGAREAKVSYKSYQRENSLRKQILIICMGAKLFKNKERNS